MIKKFAVCMLGLVMASAFAGCNADGPDAEEVTYSSTLVKKFKLQPNKKLLNHIDSVFFSIDLVNAEIFNADSLPYGLNVSRLPVSITTDACSLVQLTYRGKNGSDTTINYRSNSTDSIDFSEGPAKLHLVSYDGKAERDYTIRVNVHKVKPDSLVWDRIAMRSLPTRLPAPTAQKAVKMGETIFCLTTDGASRCIATTDDPYASQWRYITPSMDFTPQTATLTATDDALYILADDGSLYRSDDMGATWSATSEVWRSIIGNYGTMLLGVRDNGGTLVLTTLPATDERPVPAGFPVSGNSNMAVVDSRWSQSPQVITVGGRLANGSETNAVWGFDGKEWARISRNFPRSASGVTMFEYTVAKVDSASWKVTRMPALIAFGGVSEGEPLRSVYLSRDFGINWKEADILMQLPEYIDARYGAQALICDKKYSAESRYGADWTAYPSRELPTWWEPMSQPASRAVAPITEWECPYIYLFGGYDRQGNLFNQLWRGVINRLMFKPLQ